MKKTIIYMVLSLLAGALTSCGDKQSGENAERYHINFSETTTVQKENKYVLIISGSPRKGGNTDLLCDAFARGAEEVGGRVEKSFSPTTVSTISPKRTSSAWAIAPMKPKTTYLCWSIRWYGQTLSCWQVRSIT